jgi:hypothetical protein
MRLEVCRECIQIKWKMTLENKERGETKCGNQMREKLKKKNGI